MAAGNKQARTARGTFAKGSTGNPGGRPKGLAAAVREATREGINIVEFLVEAMAGRMMVASAAKANEPAAQAFIPVEPKDRIKAAEILLDRGFGKPLQTIDVGGQIAGSSPAAMTTGERQARIEQLLLGAPVVVVPAAGANGTNGANGHHGGNGTA